jgi:hypothetical protein
LNPDGGDVSIGDGNLVVADGHGIDFSATSDATGKTNELLDDYEEGTFSPTIEQGIDTQSYSNQQGHYIKIGHKVHLDIYIRINDANANGTQYIVGSFPFNLKSANHIRGGGVTTFMDLQVDSGWGSNDKVSALYGYGSSNKAFLYQGKTGVKGTNASNLDSKYLIAHFEYICA